MHSHKIKTIFFRTDGKRQDRIMEYNRPKQLSTETIFQDEISF